MSLSPNSSSNISCNCQFKLQLDLISVVSKISIALRLQLTEISHFNYDLQYYSYRNITGS